MLKSLRYNSPYCGSGLGLACFLTLYRKVYFKGSLLYFSVSSSQKLNFLIFPKKSVFLKHKSETDFYFSEIFDGVKGFVPPPIVKGTKIIGLFYFNKKLKSGNVFAQKIENRGWKYLAKIFVLHGMKITVKVFVPAPLLPANFIQ